jgi:hypothetical protein
MSIRVIDDIELEKPSVLNPKADPFTLLILVEWQTGRGQSSRTRHRRWPLRQGLRERPLLLNRRWHAARSPATVISAHLELSSHSAATAEGPSKYFFLHSFAPSFTDDGYSTRALNFPTLSRVFSGNNF